MLGDKGPGPCPMRLAVGRNGGDAMKVALVSSPRGEVRPPEGPWVQGVVEVCGVGVPLPESNLNVAEESKIATTPGA